MMDRRLGRPSRALLLLTCFAVGCAQMKGIPERYLALRDSELEYYREVATEVDFPVHVETFEDDPLAGSEAPLRITNPERREIRDITLSEAIHAALASSEIIRDQGSFFSPNNTILRNTVNVPSVYDPALSETGVLFGNRGVEAALADFDAQLTSSLTWSRNEQVQNNLFTSGGLRPGETLAEEGAQFQTRVQKTLANGGILAVQHDVNYSGNNVPSRLFPSVFTGQLSTEYRQPLLAGHGLEYTRIAGPISQAIRGVVGVNQGVVISRINTSISIADFQLAARNLLKDVEDAYWNLALAYRTWDAEVVSRDAALGTWRTLRADLEAGRRSITDEAQAQETYFDARARAESALAELYSTEGRLRRLLGLPPGDGTILRPIDTPTTAEIVPNWEISLAEALTNRVELRRQKWQLKSFELSLQAARSVARPRFDFVSSYQVNMFGDQLFGSMDNDSGATTQGLNSAYETLTQGDQTGWTLGFEFFVPIGLRLAKTQVRNQELQVAKARAALAAQELEVSHELAEAFRRLDRSYRTARTNYNRREAARKRLSATRASYDAGRQETTVDLLLRAQTAVAQAEVAYFRSLIEYNQAIAEVHYRKGTLLMQNNVQLAEGGWDPQAYTLALRRAWARTHAFEADPLLHSTPEPFETGETPEMMPFTPTDAMQPNIDDLLAPLPPEVGPIPEEDFQLEVPSPNGPAPLAPAPDVLPEALPEESQEELINWSLPAPSAEGEQHERLFAEPSPFRVQTK